MNYSRSVFLLVQWNCTIFTEISFVFPCFKGRWSPSSSLKCLIKNGFCFLWNKGQNQCEEKTSDRKGLNMLPVESHCFFGIFQPVGLSYCLNSSPHLFFFNSRRAPNRILLPLKWIVTLLGPCCILIHLESWESTFKQITILHGLSQLAFLLVNHLLLSSDFQMHINFGKGH